MGEAITIAGGAWKCDQPAPPTVATTVLQNYDGTNLLTQDAAVTNGTYTAPVANPSATAPNPSANVAKYVRNSSQTYDVLFFTAGAPGSASSRTRSP